MVCCVTIILGSASTKFAPVSHRHPFSCRFGNDIGYRITGDQVIFWDSCSTWDQINIPCLGIGVLAQINFLVKSESLPVSLHPG